MRRYLVIILLLLVLITSTVRADLAAGLVAYYPFNGNANDESGNGHNATLVGPTLTADRFGIPNSAYHLDGVNDYIRVPSQLTTNNPFTWSVWFRPDFTSTNGEMSILNQGGDPGAGEISPAIWVNQVTMPGTIVFYTWDGTGHLLPSQTRAQWNTNVWYHVAVTSDEAGNRYLYVNGVCENTATNLQFGWNCPNVYIGACPAYPAYYAGYFHGDIDEVRIYDRALSPAEIKQLYIPGKLQSIGISGPNSVPEESDTQYQVIGYYDNNSTSVITADANIIVAPDEFAMIDANGLLSTGRLYQMHEICTIYADLKGFTASKPITIYPLCDGNQCTPLQLAKRDIGDVIKIKKDVMDDLKYAMKIERVSSQLLTQIDGDKKYKGFNRSQLTKARIQILAALMWEQWANGKIDASVDSLEDALKNLQEPPVEKPKCLRK
jgi:hypothetical protein